MSITSLSAQQLRQAADLKEQLEGLEGQLNSILGGEGLASVTVKPPAASEPTKKGRRTFSAESRAKMAAAQKARWAAKRGVKEEPAEASATPEPKKKKVSEALLKALAKARAARAANLKAEKRTTKAKIIPAFRNARSEAAKAMWARRRKAAKAKKADDNVPF
jgi:colicin import membrane protein